MDEEVRNLGGGHAVGAAESGRRGGREGWENTESLAAAFSTGMKQILSHMPFTGTWFYGRWLFFHDDRAEVLQVKQVSCGRHTDCAFRR